MINPGTGDFVFLPVENIKHAHVSTHYYSGTGVVARVTRMKIHALPKDEIGYYATVDYKGHDIPEDETILLVIRKGSWVGKATVHGATMFGPLAILSEGTISEGDLLVGDQHRDVYTKTYTPADSNIGNWTSSPEKSNQPVEPTLTPDAVRRGSP